MLTRSTRQQEAARAEAKQYLLCSLMRDCDVLPPVKWCKVSANAAAAGRLPFSSATIKGGQLREVPDRSLTEESRA